MRNPSPSDNYPAVINQQFPGIRWTGRSDIHLSKYACLPMQFEGRAVGTKVLQTLYLGQYPNQLYMYLRKTFSQMEWMVKGEDWAVLVMTDLYRLLQDKQPLKTKGDLRNPRTGNRFHFVAKREHTVMGIRFWIDSGYKQYVCFRVRFEREFESEEITRSRAGETIEGAKPEYAEIQSMCEGLSGDEAMTTVAAWFSELSAPPKHQHDEDENGEDDLPY